MNNTEVNYQYKQSFRFVGDITKLNPDGSIKGTLDEYILDEDIGGLLGKYVFEEVIDVLSHEGTLDEIYSNEKNKETARLNLTTFWDAWRN